MKTLLIALVTGAAAFAGGWFLKPSEKPGPLSPVQNALRTNSTPAPREVNAAHGAVVPAARTTGTAFEPFHSLDEILTLAEGLDDWDEMGDVAAFTMMDALPRLMATDVATVRSLLEQTGAAKSKNPKLRQMAAALLGARWIMQEPEAATGYVFANPALFGTEVSSDPNHPPPAFDEDNELHTMLTWFGIAMTARRNPTSAKTMLDLLPGDSGDDLRDMLTKIEASADPGKFLTTTPPEKLAEVDDLNPLLTRWAKKDPQAALNWAQNFEDADDDAWPAIAKGWAEKDRAAATTWASSLTDADHRRAALNVIASSAVEGLDAAAMETALATFPPEVATRVRLEHFSAGDQTPAEGAAIVQAVLSRYPDDSEITDAAAAPAAAVVREFFEKGDDQAGAMAWVSRLPESAAKSRAAITLVDQWGLDDPTGTSAWIKTLPAGDTRESATTQLVNEIRSDDPAGALEWAKSISHEDSRRENMHTIFKEWLQRDPHSAMAALQQIPAEEQQAMFKQ